MNPALQIAIGVCALLPVASQALAEDAFRCTFTTECIADSPCEAREGLAARLTHDAQSWIMEMPGGATVPFSELTGAPTGGLRLISTGLDPDASAAAMLSISETGQAFLSTHGNFPTLGVVTHLGICTPEGG